MNRKKMLKVDIKKYEFLIPWYPKIINGINKKDSVLGWEAFYDPYTYYLNFTKKNVLYYKVKILVDEVGFPYVHHILIDESVAYRNLYHDLLLIDLLMFQLLLWGETRGIMVFEQNLQMRDQVKSRFQVIDAHQVLLYEGLKHEPQQNETSE